MLNDKFNKIFGKVPIIGMIHLTGEDPVKRALEEIAIFEEEGVDGAIVENYHGSMDDVERTLEATSELDTSVVIGVNVLPNEFGGAFVLAERYGADFIQLDYVAGRYTCGEFDADLYESFKIEYPDIVVFGGVWPKYYQPVEGSSLEVDLGRGRERAEAIVVTGEGTGQQTPFYKIRKFREIIGNHPLIVGAGIDHKNAYGQLSISDGAIVGSALKVDSKTINPIERGRVRDLMNVVKKVRARH